MQIDIFHGHNVRTEVVNENLAFCVKDVCDILGDANPSNVVKRIRERDLHKVEVTDSLGRPQGTWFTTERGLIRILQTSRSSLAEPFQDWADERVEQLMRGKTVNAAGTVLPTGQELLALAVLEAQQMITEKDRLLEEQRPSVEYVQNCVLADDVITVKDWGLQHGISENQAREALAKFIYRKKIGERWSRKLQRKEEEFEWRPRQTPIKDWFVLRAQHNAPRYTNGQNRQTLYIRAIRSYELAVKVGVAKPTQQELRIVS